MPAQENAAAETCANAASPRKERQKGATILTASAPSADVERAACATSLVSRTSSITLYFSTVSVCYSDCSVLLHSQCMLSTYHANHTCT